MGIGLQLYSVKEDMNKDFLGTLKKVAEIGYKGVEFAGFGGFDALELKVNLDKLGIKPIGAHISLDELKNNLDKVIDYNIKLGNPNVVCPWSNPQTKEEFIELAKFLDEAGEKLNKAGLKLSYHNHAHEFKMFDGEYGLDIIFNRTKPENLLTEVDTYWVVKAGLDAVEYIKQYSGRSPLIHIKDMADSENGESTEIGNGIIDIKAIAAQAKANGTEWLIVEQEAFTREPIEAVAICFENLKKMNLV